MAGCGPLGCQIALGALEAGGEALRYETREALIDALPDIIKPGDTVLVKASHSMGFERVVEALQNR